MQACSVLREKETLILFLNRTPVPIYSVIVREGLNYTFCVKVIIKCISLIYVFVFTFLNDKAHIPLKTSFASATQRK